MTVYSIKCLLIRSRTTQISGMILWNTLGIWVYQNIQIYTQIHLSKWCSLSLKLHLYGNLAMELETLVASKCKLSDRPIPWWAEMKPIFSVSEEAWFLFLKCLVSVSLQTWTDLIMLIQIWPKWRTTGFKQMKHHDKEHPLHFIH